jgi:hypothetical protein
MQAITPPPSLNGSHLRTFEKIFQHPVSHNLAWRDVLALFTHLGEVLVEPNGNLKISRNRHVLILPPPRSKDVTSVDELMKLRHFLEQSETALPASTKTVPQMLVVIDHHIARLFRLEMNNACPQVILPHEPFEFFRQAHDARDFFSGKEKPPQNSFFEPVAEALQHASQILLFGTGTGASSEMDQFTTWLKKHYAEVAQRIIGTATVDEHHLTEAQLLAKARNFFAHPRKT